MFREPPIRVLLVDDDVAFCKLLGDYLADEGMTPERVHDGASALQRLAAKDLDIVVLDVMLPGTNGLDVLRSTRAADTVPVLMLTARDGETDRIVGLELGADDYVPKPCNPREIAARIRAILRRTRAATSASSEPETGWLVVEDLEMLTADRLVRRAGHPVSLTTSEFQVLEVLLRHAGSVVTKEDLSTEALHREHGPFDRTIDVHVSRIRRKLGPRSDGDRRIKTVHGVGYLYARGPS